MEEMRGCGSEQKPSKRDGELEKRKIANAGGDGKQGVSG